jgi:Right handed beta helix region
MRAMPGRRGRLGAVIAGGVLVLAGAGVYVTRAGDDEPSRPAARTTATPTPTVTERPTAGNLWVDANGGTCTRRATAGDYVDASACDGFDTAYKAASCGDVVLIRAAPGGFPPQVIDAPEKECDDFITFRPAPGDATVTIGQRGVPGGVEVAGGDWMKFVGLELVDGGEKIAAAGFYLGPTGMGARERVDHIWVEDASFESFLLRGADDVTFKANDIAPGKSRHWDEKNWISVGNNGSRYVGNYSTNVVLEGNAIHGFTQEECADMGCHVECLTLEAENITIRANRIWDCDIYGVVFAVDEGYSTIGTDNLVENNFIHCCAAAGVRAVGLGSSAPDSLITFRHNSVAGTVGYEGTPEEVGRLVFDSNVIEGVSFPECDADLEMTYNLIVDGTLCGETNTRGKAGWVSPPDDLHVRADSAAVGAANPDSSTTTDLDGEPRKGAKDAGADERP